MLLFAAAATMGFMALTSVSVHAQTVSPTATGSATTTASTSMAAGSSTATSSTTSSTGSGTSLTEAGSGYLQLDGLVVTGVSSSSAPTQIYAASPLYLTADASGTVTTTVSAPSTCEEFATDSSMVGVYVGCPAPAIAPVLVTSNASSSTSTSSTASATTTYSPYTLQIDPTTQLLLAGRSPATLANFTAGDIVNVYGYYNSENGVMAAEIVRDLSKPASLTVSANTTGTDTTTVESASSSAMAMLQADLSKLETLMTQLQAQVTGTASMSAAM